MMGAWLGEFLEMHNFRFSKHLGQVRLIDSIKPPMGLVLTSNGGMQQVTSMNEMFGPRSIFREDRQIVQYIHMSDCLCQSKAISIYIYMFYLYTYTYIKFVCIYIILKQTMQSTPPLMDVLFPLVVCL